MKYIIEVSETELCTIKTSLLLERERNYGKDENIINMLQDALSAVDRFTPKK